MSEQKESNFLDRGQAAGLGVEESHVVQVYGFGLEAGLVGLLALDGPQVDEIPGAGDLEVVFVRVGERLILSCKIMVELLEFVLVIFSVRVGERLILSCKIMVELLEFVLVIFSVRVGERLILNCKIMVELLQLGLVLFSGGEFMNACAGVGGDDLGEVLVVGGGEQLQEVVAVEIGAGSEASFHLGVVAFGLLAGLEFAFDCQSAGFRVALRLGLGFEKAEERGFLRGDVKTLGLDPAGFGSGELLVELVDVEFEVGEFFLEGEAFGEEIRWEFGFIDFDEVDAGFEFVHGVVGLGFFVGRDELVAQIQQVVVVPLLTLLA